MTSSVHGALDGYAQWKCEKDRGWRTDWEQAARQRAALIETIKSNLVDRALAEIVDRDVEALQQALLAAGKTIESINAATSLLGDACRHAGQKSWTVHQLSTEPQRVDGRARLAQAQQDQLRERRELLESLRSSPRERQRQGWHSLDNARQLCADVLVEAGVDPAPALVAGTRVETRFVALPGPIAIGGSRLGGAPDGPRGFQWPDVGGTPLAFLLQLDLATVRKVLGPSDLPERGRLLFFYDLEANPWGSSPADAGGWKVIYDLTENAAPVPPPETLQVRAARLELYQVPALAPAWSREVRGLPTAAQDAYCELSEQLDRFDTRHQILGLPDPLQGWDMPRVCQLASNDVDGSEADWTLLLQLDSDYPIDLVLGRGGRLYFWIRRQDLQSSNFDNVWAIFQTT